MVDPTSRSSPSPLCAAGDSPHAEAAPVSTGHVHGHGHGHGHTELSAAGRHRWRLGVAFALIAAFFVLELVAALLAGSLSLLSDAGHMAADVVGLGAALVATRIATRPDGTGRRTYGSYRAEVFSSGLAVLVMLGVSVFTAVEAIRRIGGSPEVGSTAMIVVGAIGLVVNVIVMLMLRSGAATSLNVRGAYLEVVADSLGSVGVIVAGVLLRLTGSAWWDTGIALAIAVFVAVRAVMLGREVVAVLGQHAPAGLTVDQVATRLDTVDGVVDVHDLHLWTLTSGMNVATAHLVITEKVDAHAVLDAAGTVMRVEFGIEHATLQVEPQSHTPCRDLSW